MLKLLLLSPPASSPSQASPEPPVVTVIDTQDQSHDQSHDESPGHQSHDQSPDQSHDQSPDQSRDQSPDQSLDQLPTQSHDEMLLKPADSHGSESPPQEAEDAERADADDPIELAAQENGETEEETLVKKWSKILGPEYIVKVSSSLISLCDVCICT